MGFGLKPMNCSKKYVKEIANILNNFCNNIYTCHCTGKKAYKIMKDEINDSISSFSTGEERK